MPHEVTGKWQPIPANLSNLTLRERWNRAMHFEPVDRLPLMEFGYWDETLPEWHKQGLPEDVRTEAEAYAYFGIEDWAVAPIEVMIHPRPAMKIIEENANYTIWSDTDGAIRKEIREGVKSIPSYLRFAIESAEDWKKMKPQMDPTNPDRYPADWEEQVRAYADRDYPLSIDIGSMLGKPRNWIGFENIALMFYDNPELIEDIIETCCVCVCGTIERALKDVQFDFAQGWEDICFKNGPIVSPKMFAQYVVPRYKRITDLLHAHEIDVVWTDCDGDINPIADQFLAGGINCMFPLEVASGTDPVALREKYGKTMLLHGGVDKMPLREGPKAIEKELLRLKPVVDEGGFIPHVDHRCPMDVPLENYKFYLKLKREIFNAGNLKPHYDN